MAITRNSLTVNFSDTDATSHATASISPTANRLIIACVLGVNLTAGVDPPDPSVTGNGLTWSVVDSWSTNNFGDRFKMFVCAAKTGGAPSSGAVTFSWGATTIECAAWSVFELNGTDEPNTTVAQQFVQFVHSTLNASGTSLAVTLAAATDSNNRPFLFQMHRNNGASTPGASWTEIHDQTGSVENQSIQTQERLDVFDTAAAASWTGSVGYGGIAFEVKALVAGGGGSALDPFGMTGFFGA